jgi:iron(III) transport system ATP-binding protein
VEYDVESPIGDLFVVQYGRKEPIAPGTPVAISFVTGRGVAIIPDA